MFELKQNELLKSNRCKYMDEYNNSVTVIRTPEKIVARMRFIDENIKAAPFIIEFPLQGKEGDSLKLSYPTGYNLQKADIQAALSNFANLVTHWIDLQHDLALLEVKGMQFQKSASGVSEEEIAKRKLENLSRYDELREIVMAV